MAKTTSEIEILLGVVGMDKADAGISNFQKKALGANLTVSELGKTTRNTSQALNAFGNVAALVGRNDLAALANGAVAASQAIGGLKDGVEALGSLKAGLLIAGAVAAAGTAYSALKAFGAKADENVTASDAAAMNDRLAQTIERVINLRVQQGQIEKAIGDQIIGQLNEARKSHINQSLSEKDFGSLLHGIAGNVNSSSGDFSDKSIQVRQQELDYEIKLNAAATERDLFNASRADIDKNTLFNLQRTIPLLQEKNRLLEESTKLSKPYDSMTAAEKEEDAARILEVSNATLQNDIAISKMQQQIQSISAKDSYIFQIDMQVQKLNDSLGTTQEQLGRVFSSGIQSAANGLADAIVATASGAMKAKDAFKQFARSFLSDISKMILQQTILGILTKAIGGIAGSFTGWNAPSIATAYADGGQIRKAASGAQFVSTATHFPDWNVMTGEAGRELMTVMARPRAMSIGGVAAQVGNVGPTRTAVMRADDFERTATSASKPAVVEIRPAPGYEAEIIRQSAERGLQLVTAQMGRGQNNLTQATKRLVQ